MILAGCGSTAQQVQAKPNAQHSQSTSRPIGAPVDSNGSVTPAVPDDSMRTTPEASLKFAPPSKKSMNDARPGDLPLKDPHVNKNVQSTPMGKACWAFSEFSNMVSSFAVPITQGKPLYANEYPDDAVKTGARPGDIRAYQKLFLAQLGDSEQWSGVRAFVTAAKANSNCHLDAAS